MKTDTPPVWAHLVATPPPNLDRRIAAPRPISADTPDPWLLAVAGGISATVALLAVIGALTVAGWVFRALGF